eukprot:765292-Hanusia_phi.AAC.2
MGTNLQDKASKIIASNNTTLTFLLPSGVQLHQLRVLYRQSLSVTQGAPFVLPAPGQLRAQGLPHRLAPLVMHAGLQVVMVPQDAARERGEVGGLEEEEEVLPGGELEHVRHPLRLRGELGAASLVGVGLSASQPVSRRADHAACARPPGASARGPASGCPWRDARRRT